MFALGENVPVPFVVQVPPEAIVTVPPKLTEETSEQTIWSMFAFTTGIGVNVTFTMSDTGEHAPVKVVVRVNVTDPAAVSAALGV